MKMRLSKQEMNEGGWQRNALILGRPVFKVRTTGAAGN